MRKVRKVYQQTCVFLGIGVLTLTVNPIPKRQPPSTPTKAAIHGGRATQGGSRMGEWR